jgi:acyl carrier protein
MAGRTQLNEADFALLFPGAEESAIAVRHAVAAALPGDGLLMLPADRIVKDLMADAMDGVNTNEIVAKLERRFSIRIPDARASEVRTVQELVDLVQSLRDGALKVIP